MGVKSDLSSIYKELDAIPMRAERQVLSAMTQAGEQLVQIARSTKTYQDQSGNLTASIGYGVFKGRSLVASGGFDYTAQGGSLGAMELLQHIPNVSQGSISLVVIAGMDYATYVERTGHVVLDGAMLRAETIVDNLLRQLRL